MYEPDAEKERMRLYDALRARDTTIAVLRAMVEHWKRDCAVTEEAAKRAEADLAELRTEVDTLAKAWRKAEDENDELRAAVERLRAEFASLQAERDKYHRQSQDLKQDLRRGASAEADLAEAVAVARELDDALADFEPESRTGSYQQVRGRAATLLAKVKP